MSVSWNILAGCVRTKIVFAENSFTTEDAEDTEDKKDKEGKKGKEGKEKNFLHFFQKTLKQSVSEE